MTVSTTPLTMIGGRTYQQAVTLTVVADKLFMDQRSLSVMDSQYYHMTMFPAYVVCHGRHKPLIGQHNTETTTGQTQQLLIVLSTTDVMWWAWHIVSADKMNG